MQLGLRSFLPVGDPAPGCEDGQMATSFIGLSLEDGRPDKPITCLV